jgi:hypothetical protein
VKAFAEEMVIIFVGKSQVKWRVEIIEKGNSKGKVIRHWEIQSTQGMRFCRCIYDRQNVTSVAGSRLGRSSWKRSRKQNSDRG